MTFRSEKLRRAKYMQTLVRDPIIGWSCEGAGLRTFGVIPTTAYERWKGELLDRAKQRRAARPLSILDRLAASMFKGAA